MYDWANSAYATALATAVLPLYFAGVVVPADGFSIGGTRYAADTLWSFLVAGAALLVFLLAPTLGAIADLSATKKRFLVAFCYAGVVSATLLYFSGPGDVWWTMVCFLIAHACFVSANVFYDSFLPQIARRETGLAVEQRLRLRLHRWRIAVRIRIGADLRSPTPRH